uniref:Uncharacterized protein n=1 Tax=Anguilla anguilla TaxID=7936 RepID=A0A0E9PJI8_ANGAN
MLLGCCSEFYAVSLSAGSVHHFFPG